MKGFACLVAVAAFAACYAGGKTQGLPLSLGRQIVSGGLVVIPILSNEEQNPAEILFLPDAVKSGKAKIFAAKGVSAVGVLNEANQPVAVLGGMVLGGGGQDQSIEKDVVLSPGETALVASFCVEPGRSTGGTAFLATDMFVPDWMRSIEANAGLRLVGKSRAQDQVWNEVGKLNAAQGKENPTGTIRATLEDPDLHEAIDESVAKLSARLGNSERAVGMMLCLNGKIFSADVFANHKLFSQVRGNLLRTYALTAFVASVEKTDLGDVQGFLEAICSSQRRAVDKTRSSVSYGIHSDGILGIESGLPGFAGEPGGAGRPGFVHGIYLPASLG